MSTILAAVAVGQADRVSALLADLASEQPEVRRHAARKLGDLAVWEAAGPLVEILADPDGDVREEARASLVQIGEGAVDALLDGLTSPAPTVRAGCAEVLGQLGWIGDERMARALLPLLKDPIPKVRLAVVQALEDLADETATDQLRQVLDDEDLAVRAAAASALTKLGDGSGLPVLLSAATNGDSRTKMIAVGGLMRIATPPAIQALRDLTTDADADVRRSAYVSLLALQKPETVQMSLDGLHDPSRTVRRDLAHAMSIYTPPNAADALLETLRTDESASVRVAAGIALANMGDKRAVPILLDMLGPGHRDFERAGAADALGTLRSQEAIKPLSELVNDEDARVQRAARLALRMILEECPDCP